MALSGSVSTGNFQGRYYKLSWSATQSISKNTSVISWKLEALGGTDSWYAERTVKVKIAGAEVFSKTNRVQRYKGTVASGTKTINHNNKGEAWFSVSVDVAVYYSAVNCTGSGSFTLNTIPRSSSISSVTGDTIGSNVTVKITPADESFTHKLLYYPAGITTATKLTVDETNNQCIFKPSLNDCTYIPNATSGTAKLTLETYSGTTKIGTVDKTFTLKVPDSVKPTVSISVEDSNASIYNRAGGYLKGFSKLKITLTGLGNGKSTIKSYKVTVDNATYNPAVSNPTITTDVLQKSGTIEIKAQVTDSRGRVGEASTTVNVLDYKPPYIDSFTVERCNADGTLSDEGTSVAVTVKGGITDLKVDSVSINKAYYRLYFKKTTESAYTSIGYPGATEDTMYLDGSTPQIFQGFDTESAYNMYFEIRDLFSRSTLAYNISTAFTLVDYYKDGKGIAFGKVATETGVADFNLKIKANKGIIYPEIPINTNFNDLRTTGIYKSLNQKANTYSNCPVSSGTFLLEVYEAGNEGQLLQRVTTCYKGTSVKYERFYYSGAWDTTWRKVYDQAIYDNIEKYSVDTGWIDVTLADGISHGSEGNLRARLKQGVLYIHGSVKGISKNYQHIASLPSTIYSKITIPSRTRFTGVYNISLPCVLSLYVEGSLWGVTCPSGTWDATKMININMAIPVIT